MADVREIFPKYWDQTKWHKLGGGDLFGNADVDVLLKDAAGGSEYQWEDVDNLREARNLILKYMVSHHGNLHLADQNKPGGKGENGITGMYDKLANDEIYETWGDHTGPDGPDRKKYFGGADLRVALAKGISKRTILKKLEEKSLDWLKPDSVNRPISQGGKAHGIYTFLTDEATSTNYGKATTDVIPGAGGDLFGNVEYFKNLEKLWEENDKDHAVLHEYRKNILEFLATENNPKVHDDNRPPSMGGKSTGMWQQINDHVRKPKTGGAWGDDQIKITPWFGGQDPEGIDSTDTARGERHQFTEADRLAAIAGGHTSYDIYRHLHANPNQRQNEAATQTYNYVRSNLINQSPLYSEYSEDNWLQTMQSPIWYEIGVHLSNTNSQHDHRTWVDFSDYTILRNYIRESLNAAGVDIPGRNRGTPERFTEEHLNVIVGNVSGTPTGGYEPGKYWSQWGVSGPPDLQGTEEAPQPGDSDLTWIQKMVAAAGLQSEDPSTWQERLEYIENRFLDELYKGVEDSVDEDHPYGPRFASAGDEWGLDIMRLDAEGDELEFDDAPWEDDATKLQGSRGDEWYNTLTRGKIDWAFYQDSALYQKAKEELGLQGTYTAGSLGVAGIRQANVWVHGQLAVKPTGAPDWDPYVANPLPAPYTPKELTITGYTPDKPKGLAPVPEDPTAPTINIPDVKIERPSNLKSKIGKIVGEGSDSGPPIETY